MFSIGRLGGVLVGGLVAAHPAQAAREKVIYSFLGGSDGSGAPTTGVVTRGLTLYGTTAGTVYAVTAAGAYSLLHTFRGGNDGSGAQAGLISVGDRLYGTTEYGGAGNAGTVFSITPAGIENVVYAFKGTSDGGEPLGGLIDVGGTLYGTTSLGGANFSGTVFSVTKTGVEKVIYSFKGGSDGATPFANLLSVGGTLYGTTKEGGAGACIGLPAGCGTVFAVTPAGTETVLHAFQEGGDGAFPTSGLINVGGTLYGTTQYGGGATAVCSVPVDGCGTVYSITTGGVEAVIYSFQNNSTGIYPLGALLEVGGKLYGTTSFGGCDSGNDTGVGTVFSVTPAGAEKVLYCFGMNSDGYRPAAGLTKLGRKLYGTTQYGTTQSEPPPGWGTVFSFKLR
jgi:uncharacterized repeat protein (TIGR03803 family)